MTDVSPGCRLEAPAGWLHRNLAGPPYRVVLGTNLPGDQWTAPINKDPAERPACLAICETDCPIAGSAAFALAPIRTSGAGVGRAQPVGATTVSWAA